MAASSRPNLSSPDLAAAYLRGVPKQSSDFEFMVGEWSVQATRYADDGNEIAGYAGHWVAEYLCDGRVLFDRFTAFAPDGRSIANSATLRTYCELTERWEMAFVNAGQAPRVESFSGRKAGNEMHLEAVGLDLAGRRCEASVRFFDIGKDAFTWEQHSRLEGNERWYKDSTLRAERVG